MLPSQKYTAPTDKLFVTPPSRDNPASWVGPLASSVFSPGGDLGRWVAFAHVVSWLAAIVSGGLAYMEVNDLSGTQYDKAKIVALLAVIFPVVSVVLILVHAGWSVKTNNLHPVNTSVLFALLTISVMLSAVNLSFCISVADAFNSAIVSACFTCLSAVMPPVFYFKFYASD